jgi:predicted Rossmann fold flavoprotein
MTRIAIIGAGASGFFAALEVKKRLPLSTVVLLEKSNTPLSKVRLSGGGRCNVTNACLDPKSLSLHYPRGGKFLIPLFHSFQPKDMMDWLSERGVSLKTEENGRVFPSTGKSETIISCLLQEQKKLGIPLELNKQLQSIQPRKSGLALINADGQEELFNSILMATGSAQEPLEWLHSLNIEIVPQVPSLFAFSCPTSPLLSLSGITVSNVTINLLGTSISGPLLLTHLGFSGPAILKLSSLLARKLSEISYKASFFIDWLPNVSFPILQEKIQNIKKLCPSQKMNKNPFPEISHSLWITLLNLSRSKPEMSWNDLSTPKKEMLIQTLKKMSFHLEGKTSNKQEFVTAGGVSLQEVDPKTLESKKIPGLFFAGELLDIDGITGGFNLQAAWTTGYIAAQGIVQKENGL